MILKKFGKTFIRENLSRIEISEFSEICLYESFEICYLRKCLWQKFLQIKSQLIHMY